MASRCSQLGHFAARTSCIAGHSRRFLPGKMQHRERQPVMSFLLAESLPPSENCSPRNGVRPASRLKLWRNNSNDDRSRYLCCDTIAFLTVAHYTSKPRGIHKDLDVISFSMLFRAGYEIACLVSNEWWIYLRIDRVEIRIAPNVQV